MVENKDVRDSNGYGKYKLVDSVIINGRKCFNVEFLSTGYRKVVQQKEFDSGSIKDPLYPSIKGVGYCSDPNTPRSYKENGKTVRTPSYEVWLGILKRCYTKQSTSYSNYGGRGVVICEEWKDFSIFHEWFTKHYVDGCVLDKDILSNNYRGIIYSPDTCRFVPPIINGFFTNSRNARGLYPVGVCKKVNKNGSFRYIAQVGDLVSRQMVLGRFLTMHEAFCAYKEVREKQAKLLAEEYFKLGKLTEDVYIRLIKWEAVPYP